MKTKVFIVLTALVTVFAACQKDLEEGIDNGTSTDDYQPTTTGSTWQYRSTSGGDYTETAVDDDTTIDGQAYTAFDNTANGRRYVNKNNGIYTSYGRILPQIDTSISLLYLKDAPAGTKWSNISVYSGVPISLNYTIASRDGEMMVNNTNYTNVIALDFTVTATNPLSGQTLTLGNGKQVFAKGVGGIINTLNLNTGTNLINDSTYLVSADIK